MVPANTWRIIQTTRSRVVRLRTHFNVNHPTLLQMKDGEGLFDNCQLFAKVGHRAYLADSGRIPWPSSLSW